MMTENERKYGPRGDETIAEVRARIDRQADAAYLIGILAEFHPRAAAYTDPKDWAAQVATVLLADFSIRRKKGV